MSHSPLGVKELLAWAQSTSGVFPCSRFSHLRDGLVLLGLLQRLFPRAIERSRVTARFRGAAHAQENWAQLLACMETRGIPTHATQRAAITRGDEAACLNTLVLLYFLYRLARSEDFTVDFTFPVDAGIAAFLQSPASLAVVGKGPEKAAASSSSPSSRSHSQRRRSDGYHPHLNDSLDGVGGHRSARGGGDGQRRQQQQQQQQQQPPVLSSLSSSSLGEGHVHHSGAFSAAAGKDTGSGGGDDSFYDGCDGGGGHDDSDTLLLAAMLDRARRGRRLSQPQSPTDGGGRPLTVAPAHPPPRVPTQLLPQTSQTGHAPSSAAVGGEEGEGEEGEPLPPPSITTTTTTTAGSGRRGCGEATGGGTGAAGGAVASALVPVLDSDAPPVETAAVRVENALLREEVAHVRRACNVLLLQQRGLVAAELARAAEEFTAAADRMRLDHAHALRRQEILLSRDAGCDHRPSPACSAARDPTEGATTAEATASDVALLYAMLTETRARHADFVATVQGIFQSMIDVSASGGEPASAAASPDAAHEEAMVQAVIAALGEGRSAPPPTRHAGSGGLVDAAAGVLHTLLANLRQQRASCERLRWELQHSDEVFGPQRLRGSGNRENTCGDDDEGAGSSTAVQVMERGELEAAHRTIATLKAALADSQRRQQQQQQYQEMEMAMGPRQPATAVGAEDKENSCDVRPLQSPFLLPKKGTCATSPAADASAAACSAEAERRWLTRLRASEDKYAALALRTRQVEETAARDSAECRKLYERTNSLISRFCAAASGDDECHHTATACVAADVVEGLRRALEEWQGGRAAFERMEAIIQEQQAIIARLERGEGQRRIRVVGANGGGVDGTGGGAAAPRPLPSSPFAAGPLALGPTTTATATAGSGGSSGASPPEVADHRRLLLLSPEELERRKEAILSKYTVT